jgi:hypothetical protein
VQRLFHLLCSVTLFAAGSVEAQSRLALDWQVFKVPDYGTRLEYPASIFSAVGRAETGAGQRFESDDGRAVLSIYARVNEDGDTPASYLRRICGYPASTTNGSLALSLRFQWSGREQLLQPMQLLALCSWCHSLL